MNQIINTFKIAAVLAVLLLFPSWANAQTATPNTTLCAAQSQTALFVCLTATTGVVNQTGVYVDGEYELVQLSNTQVVCTGPCNVPVSRNNRNAGSGPTAHINASIAWLALTPSASVVPGLNGFSLATNVNDIGACTRGNQTYLPHIFVNRNIKRDCVAVTNNTAIGVWVDFAPGSGLDYPSPSPSVNVGASGALSVSSGNYVITKAGVAAMTLAAPTAGVQDGMIIVLISDTAYAHTLTATSLLENGASGSPYTTATFGAYIGANITLRAYNGTWVVIAVSNVSLS